LKPIETRVERAWFQLLKLKDDNKLPSSFALSFNLRRYVAVCIDDLKVGAAAVQVKPH